MSKRDVYRILDAAANRGREALRVVEDAARFLDDDAELAARLKETRHRFAAASERLDRRERLSARDTDGDVGTSVATDDEYRRASLADILAANFARLQESARSLEEFSKIVAPRTAADWEQIRYAAYSLEKLAFEALARRGSDPLADDGYEDDPESEDDETGEIFERIETFETPEPEFAERPEAFSRSEPETEREPSASLAFPFASRRRDDADRRAWRLARLAASAFCSFADATLSEDDFFSFVRAGVDAFQFVFDPRTDFGENESIGRFRGAVDAEFARPGLSPQERPLLFLRDRIDWVGPFDFDGASLSRGADWEAAREALGPNALLGATVSTLDEAFAAFQASAFGILDFIEAGPVFAPNGVAATGTAFLRAISEATAGAPPIPVFAVGGIDPSNLTEIFDSGIERVGVGAAVLSAVDRQAAVERLKGLF